jgi:putative ABC transport system ATP-binding protein
MDDAMNSPLIEASGLTRNYATQPGVVAGVSELSLRVERGEFVVIQGASGSGKSTLLLLLGALLRPERGTLRIDGVDLTRINAVGMSRYRARSVGFVFQLFHLVPYLSVHGNVLAGLPPGSVVDPAEADRWVEVLGLTARRNSAPATLSAGERQRVALARALIKRPSLILADEPTGNLDPDNAARVLEHLDHYRRSGGTVVLVTHGSEANRYATQRLRLEAGRWAIPSAFPPLNDSVS